VDKIISEVLKLFSGFQSNWSGTQVNTLYTEFETKVNSIPHQSFDSDEFVLSPPENLWEEWVKKNKFFGETDGVGDPPPKAPEGETPEEITADKWEDILDAEGWTTKWPQSSDI